MNNDLISRDYVVMVYNRVKEACKNCDNYNGVRCRACDIGDELLDLQDIIDNAPTVEYSFYQEAYQTGYEEGKNEKPQGDLADEVWKLYEKYQPRLATNVIEFGDELKDLLGKYQKGGAK